MDMKGMNLIDSSQHYTNVIGVTRMTCEGCGERQIVRAASGFCRWCYKKQFKILERGGINKKEIRGECPTCGVETRGKRIHAVCNACYKRQFFADPKRKAIARARTALWRLENPEQYKENNRRTSREIKNRFSLAKAGAKSRDIPWSISFEKFRGFIATDKCHYCNGQLNEVGANLDRKDSKIGYHEYNCVPCCWSCNKIKSDQLTEAEMLVAMRAVVALRSRKDGQNYA